MPGLLRPVAALLLGALLVYGGNRLLFADGDGYVVTAEFADSAGVTPNSDVKVAGVVAGSVRAVRLTERDTAEVELVLDDGAHPIGAGASAASRPVNLLGEKYIDLRPGDLRRPRPSGTRLGRADTSRPVELDDVFNTLDPDTRARMRLLINEAGASMLGRGTDLNAVLDQLPPALDQATGVLARFGRDTATLRRLIDQSDRVVGAFDGRRDDVQRFVVELADALGVVAARRRELGATLREAPASLRQLTSTLAELEATAGRLRPAAASLRQAAPALDATLRALPGFTRDARPALHALRSSAPEVRRLSRGALPAVRDLRPTARRLDAFARQLAPVTRALDEGGVARDALRVMFGWAETIRATDGLGHIFGLRLNVDDQAVRGTVERLLQRRLPLPAGRRRGKDRPAAPRPQPRPRPRPQAPGPKLPEVPGDVPDVHLPGTASDAIGRMGDLLGRVTGR